MTCKTNHADWDQICPANNRFGHQKNDDRPQMIKIDSIPGCAEKKMYRMGSYKSTEKTTDFCFNYKASSTINESL